MNDMTADHQYLINEAQMLLLVMQADTKPAQDARAEIIAIIKAWKRGCLLPKAECPVLQKLYGRSFNQPPLQVV